MKVAEDTANGGGSQRRKKPTEGEGNGEKRQGMEKEEDLLDGEVALALRELLEVAVGLAPRRDRVRPDLLLALLHDIAK